MEKYGFTALTSDQISGLKELNSKFTPIGLRYQGMGWYDVCVKYNDKYKIVNMGGENGYTAREHDENYAKLTSLDFISEEELMKELAKSNWTEIVSQKKDKTTC